MPAAQVLLQLKSQVAPQIAAAVASYQSLSAAEQKAQQSAASYALSLQKVEAQDIRTATEEQRLAVQTANVAKAQSQAEQAALRLATAQNKAASSSGLAGQFADGLKSGLLGIVGPAALAAGAIGLLIGTANSFKEAFAFKAQLDSTNASIAISLQGIRDSGQTFQEAAAFANKYKLTQEETGQAIQASIPILRSSNSSLTDIESTLLRLQAKKPEKSIADAARALDELKSGQIISIVDQFNVSRDAANKMKNEIAGGADAVTVLSKYLESAGFGMAALEIRTKGATGAINDARVASEQLKLAQGRLAESAGGIAFVEEEARVYRGLANILNGDIISGLKANATEFVASQAAQRAHTAALTAGKTEAEAAAIALRVYTQVLHDAQVQEGLIPPDVDHHTKSTAALTNALNTNRDALDADALKKLDSTIATAQMAQQQAQLDADSKRAAQGMLEAGDQALILAKKYGIATDQAQFLIDQQKKLGNATALADQRAGERTGTDLTASQFDKFSKLSSTQAAADAKKKADDEKKLADANDALRLSRAKTSAQKIAELQRQQAETSDPVERIKLQTQIEQERNSASKAHTADLTKQLGIHESIFDSLNKQRDAQLSIIELTIKNRQDTRDEDAKLKTANAILNSPNASADYRARAQDAIDLINVQRQQRQQKLREEGATAGGTIDARGKLLQSVPGGGGAPVGGTGATGATGASGTAAPGGAPGGGGTPLSITNNFIVDGKTIATETQSFIIDEIMHAVRAVHATEGIH